MKKVAIIIGSTRPNRRSLTVAKWIKSVLSSSKEITFDTIDLKKINLPFLDESALPALGKYSQEHTKKWSALIKSYDGLILLFPQYNSGYPAPLKNALDYLGKEWSNKPISMVTYGAHGGLQAQIAMKLVLTGFHAKQLAVNPQISINPMDSDEDVTTKLNAYNFEIELLEREFEHVLAN